MPRRKARKFVLFGCPIDIHRRYDEQGYVGSVDGALQLVESRDNAIVYTDKKSGHGSAADWVKILKDSYKLNVCPVFFPS